MVPILKKVVQSKQMKQATRKKNKTKEVNYTPTTQQQNLPCRGKSADLDLCAKPRHFYSERDDTWETQSHSQQPTHKHTHISVHTNTTTHIHDLKSMGLQTGIMVAVVVVWRWWRRSLQSDPSA